MANAKLFYIDVHIASNAIAAPNELAVYVPPPRVGLNVNPIVVAALRGEPSRDLG
jgi:hypothetical protein